MYTLYAFIIKQKYIVAVSYLVQITAKFTLAISGGNKYKRLDNLCYGKFELLMAQNDNLKLFMNKSGKNYTINNQSIIRRLEASTGPMDIDNPDTKHDATQKRKFNTSNSYLSLADVDGPHDKWLSKISFNEVQEVEEVLPGNDRTERNNPHQYI
ncbi:hypothetical protein V1477_002162 [Vespula maculifrons]|uniref:Uncharacterized protein n=1 Tax=Vespula maculifrons TaxID=7453 RepID=A0ABD2CVX6_VESMC